MITPKLVKAIIKAERPHGWGVLESRHRARALSGNTVAYDDGDQVIRIPMIKGNTNLRYTLLIYFHEVGHIVLGHFKDGCDKPKHIEEYEAEKFAINKMHEYGIHVKRIDLHLAKRNVRDAIKYDKARNVKIDPKIRRWSK